MCISIRKYLLLFFFSASTLFSQEIVFSLTYPMVSYSPEFSDVSSNDGKVFYGLGVGAIASIKNNSWVYKTNIMFGSFQNITTNKNSFAHLSLNVFLNYLYCNKFYGGIGVGIHKYAIVPSVELSQFSFSSNIGLYLNKNIFLDIVYDYMINKDKLQFSNSIIILIGYQF